jgi:hypothetical protein
MSEEKIDPKELKAFNLGYELQRLAPELASRFEKAMGETPNDARNKAFTKGLEKSREQSKEKAYNRHLNIEPGKVTKQDRDKLPDLDRSKSGMDRDK